MEKKKAYFVDNEQTTLFELSASKRKQLEKLHPDWESYNCDDNYHSLQEVYDFFKKHGKLLAHPSFKNIFVGLVA